MTTEDDFQAALDANPDDWQTRLVFADWLEEHAGEVVCTKCDPDHRGHIYTGMDGMKWIPCGCAKGLVSDGRRERADGYRALAFRQKHPKGHCGYVFFGWKSERGEIHGFPELTLPDDWYRQLDGYYSQRGWWQPTPTEVGNDRREAEDAAALAFAKLPADRQRELLRPDAALTPGATAAPA